MNGKQGKQLVNDILCTKEVQIQERLERKAKEQEERLMEQGHINDSLKKLNTE